MSDRDRHVRRLGEDYGSALMSLLPQGQAWPKTPGTTLDLAVRGLAEYWGVVDGRAADLLEIESDPRKTVELLPDWERNFGLPDECYPPPETIEGRQTELVERMTMLGAQSRDFYEDLASKHGEDIHPIEEHAPYMCGVSRVGDTRVPPDPPDDPTGYPYFRWELGAPEIRYYWNVNIEHVLSGVDCLLDRYRPAHTDVVFRYVGTLDRSVSMYPYLGV